MQNLVLFILGVMLILSWGFAVYTAGYSAAMRRHREIEDAVYKTTRREREASAETES